MGAVAGAVMMSSNINSHGNLTPWELLFTIIISQYIIIVVMVCMREFKTKKRLFLNCIPFWWIIEVTSCCIKSIKKME